MPFLLPPKFPLIYLLTIFLSIVVVTVTCQVIRSGCPDKCGNVTIPYPFGIGQGCAFDHNFAINCDRTYNPPKPFLRGNSLQLIDISLDGHLRKYSYVARDCYNWSTVGKDKDHDSYTARSVLDEFYYSPTRNRLFAVGCDTEARLSGSSAREIYASGCISICYNKSSVVNGSCSGIGCCETAIPQQLNMFNVTLESFSDHKMVWDFNPCSFAFIADADFYNFSTVDLVTMPDQVPAVLDWAVGVQDCESAVKNVTGYACKENSVCRDSDNGPGYRCFCSAGYAGNPYVPAGCVDVNECKDPSLNDCIHNCHNTKGNYTCSCPKWFNGDGRRNGIGCTLDQRRISGFIIGTGIFLILLAIGTLVLLGYTKKRKEKRLKENFFKKNGGLILQDRIFKSKRSINSIKIFNLEELQKATDTFSEDRICGRGGFGTVYKGHLSDGSEVAIKKSTLVDQSQIEQFINEITVLSQINHRNVVRFLGCCLETSVPLLIYEFITNGNLCDHLHNESNRLMMSWQTRLKIAAETAGVLAYLHSAHHTPIIHRDIKPTNILLDDDYTAKVSDFGSSRLFPKNEIEMCTMVQGTLGYLDPEYFLSSQLTDKSDVYSFGVVLAELLTGQKAVCFERVDDNRSLVNYFLSSINNDRLLEILDKGMMNEDNVEEIVKVVEIAKRCLMVKGEERPTMKEVAMELESLLMELKHKFSINDINTEESNNLCGINTPLTEYMRRMGEELSSVKIDDGR